MSRSSRARSIGIVVTATAPAFSTPNQQATSQGLFGPRSSTRLPGDDAELSGQQVGDPVGGGEQVA